MKSSLLASAAVPLTLPAQTFSSAPSQPASPATAGPAKTLPTGKLDGKEVSRLILGGNLIGGHSYNGSAA